MLMDFRKSKSLFNSARWLAIAASCGLLATAMRAQTRPGPIPPGKEDPVVLRPATPTNVEPPPVPAAQIIQTFAQNELAMAQARPNYVYRKSVKVQEYDDTGKAAGDLQFTNEVYAGPDGKTYERAVKHALSTIESMNMVEEDTSPLSRLPMFPFTPRELPKYEFTYLGKQKLDELNTYIFEVHPKQVERTVGLFDGVIWVDTEDLVIVKTTGKWVTELGPVTSRQFPFTVYDTYRENVSGKIWFPAYLRSDGAVPTKNGAAQLKLTVTWQDYKPAAPAAPPQPQH